MLKDRVRGELFLYWGFDSYFPNCCDSSRYTLAVVDVSVVKEIAKITVKWPWTVMSRGEPCQY